MRSFLIGISLPTFLILSALGMPGSRAADLPKDSAPAELTRNHKLKVKVTLKFKQEQLKAIFDDINSQVTDVKVGGQKLTKIRFIPDTGISFNSRMDIDVKDVTVEEALDKLLKPNDLGYIVIIGKKNEQNDGAIQIVKGDNRGYPTPTDPKKK